MKYTKNILIYRLGSIGDTIVSLPILNKIYNLNPDKNLIILTNQSANSNITSMESILGKSGIIKKFITYKSHKLSIREVFKLFHNIRKIKVEELYYMIEGRSFVQVWRDYIFFKLCGIKKIVGFPWTSEYRRPLILNDQNLERECERLVRCFSCLGEIDLNDINNWNLHIKEEEKEKFDQIISSFSFSEIICINMGGKLKAQDWGRKNWENFITKLNKFLKNKGILLMIIGSSKEFERGEKVSVSWEGDVLNLCGLLNPRESAFAISKATMFVGHDSGPIHLAESAKVPCVGIYGPLLKAKEWHPFGSIHKILHNSNNIFDITVDDVLKNTLKLRKEILNLK